MKSGHLRRVPPDLFKAQRFWSMARENLEELPNIHSEHVRYAVAYNASHDVGEGLMAAFGFRTAGNQGQHVSVGKFMKVVLGESSAVEAFDSLRMKRNQIRYVGTGVGSAEVALAADVGKTLLARAEQLLGA
ncbi:MAG: hypothetical protein U0904_07650 [Candidatus Nanopelagicales bacterium]|nr:hypothetical protein [Candidatus Nanopelagicales bacterium]